MEVFNRDNRQVRADAREEVKEPQAVTEQRRCTDCHQPFTPEGKAVTCPSCIQELIDDHGAPDDEDCGQCDGSGYWYHCIDGCCLNADEGCDLCARRCDFCNPFKPTPAQAEERAQLGEILADAISKQKP